MDRKRHLCRLAEPCHEVMEPHGADRPAALGNEDVGFARVLAAQPAQCSDLVTTDGMDARGASLGPADVQPALVEFDLMPLEAADFAGSQPMAIGDQDHGGVAVTMPTHFAGSIHELLNLALGQVATLDCEAFDGWCAVIGYLICHDKSLSG